MPILNLVIHEAQLMTRQDFRVCKEQIEQHSLELGHWIEWSASAAPPCDPRRLLLVLDNYRHLVAACAALVDASLRACPT